MFLRYLLVFTAIIGVGGASAKGFDAVSSEERLSLIRSAQVWHPTDIPNLDLWRGPLESDRIEFEQRLGCVYDPVILHGTTSKFQCTMENGRKLKVRYDAANGKVYAMPAATRLFWALGFGAVRSWPARVQCRNCPEDPFASPYDSEVADRLFHPAVVDVKMKGDKIELDGSEKSGWSWEELDEVDPAKGGAPKAHRDALKLLAAFVQHGDNNAGQQALICLPGGAQSIGKKTVCKRPFMFVEDLGSTFGGSDRLDERASMNLEAWESHPIWSDPRHCVADLAHTPGGTLNYPRISEAGRSFLSRLLAQLSDRQIADLFRVGRADRRNQSESGVPSARSHSFAPISEWVRAFKAKRDEIARATCPR